MPRFEGKRKILILAFLFVSLFMVGVTHSMAMDQMMAAQECTPVAKCCDCTIPEISETPSAHPTFYFERIVEFSPLVNPDAISFSLFHPPK